MNHILLVGDNHLAVRIIEFIAKSPNLNVFVLQQRQNEEMLQALAKYKIKSFKQVEDCKGLQFEYIFFTEKNEELEKELLKYAKSSQFFYEETLELMDEVISSQFLFSLKEMNEFENVKTMLNSIRDGIIVIDANERIQFINQAALQFLNRVKADVIYEKIRTVLPHSRLPYILQTQQKEENELFHLTDNQTIVTTRIPLFDSNNHLIGAFAIFKAQEEVIQLAEDSTNLKQLQKMLDAIIHASGEAISVVDENGKGLLFNSAYTKLTGLNPDDVIGKPATIDIREGKSIHLEVLNKRRSIHGASMKVGKYEKDVLVNATPIIVDGKIQGSIAVIQDISEMKKLSNELKKARQMIRNLESTYTFKDVIGQSQEIELAVQQAKIGAMTNVPVMLKGDTGVGKELFAHAIHNESDRKYNKFIRVNCSTISHSIIESQLFGYEEKSMGNKHTVIEKGVFEEANEGTVFLDEIASLPLHVQKQLADVIKKKEVVREGGQDFIPIDVKIIAASHKNIDQLKVNGLFDQKLYTLLHQLPIKIPALQERIEDLPELVELIINEKNELYGRQVKTISSAALNELKGYSWPGNVRELENVIDRAIIFMNQEESIIELKHLSLLSDQKKQETDEDNYTTLQEAVDSFEKQYIGKVYKSNKYNKSKTAKELNISLRNLYYKIDKYELDI